MTDDLMALDEKRLAAAARMVNLSPEVEVVYTRDGRAKVGTSWRRTFWSQVQTNVERNIRRRMLYTQAGGSERSPLNPINPVWNH